MREHITEKLKTLLLRPYRPRKLGENTGKEINLHVWEPVDGGTMLYWHPFPVNDPTLGIFGGVGWFPMMAHDSPRRKQAIQRAITAAESRGYTVNVVHAPLPEQHESILEARSQKHEEQMVQDLQAIEREDLDSDSVRDRVRKLARKYDYRPMVSAHDGHWDPAPFYDHFWDAADRIECNIVFYYVPTPPQYELIVGLEEEGSYPYHMDWDLYRKPS